VGNVKTNIWDGKMSSAMILRLACYILSAWMVVATSSCSSPSARYEEKVTQLRAKVRQSFSPKFDPIWIGREKKVEKAKQELDRLIAVMEDALKELEEYTLPRDMVPFHNAHKNLFEDCRSALVRIREEASKENPKGMTAVRIYKDITRKILEAEEGV
jgi:hypothetical protein